MNLRDDNDIYRAKLLWLGPPGYTLPVHLPYAQWGVGALLSAVISLVLILLTGDFTYIGLGLSLGIFATYLLWKHVDPDRPARTVVRAAVLDAQAVLPPEGDEQLPRLTASHITITATPEG